MDTFFAPRAVRVLSSCTVLLHFLGSGSARIDRDAARRTVPFDVFELNDLSVALSLENAARNHGTLGAGRANKAFSFDGFVGDMFDAVASNSALSNNRSVGGKQLLLRESRPFDVILFNPPQTGGNEAFGSSRFRLEKYGGEDGSLFYRRFGTRPTCIAVCCYCSTTW